MNKQIRFLGVFLAGAACGWLLKSRDEKETRIIAAAPEAGAVPAPPARSSPPQPRAAWNAPAQTKEPRAKIAPAGGLARPEAESIRSEMKVSLAATYGAEKSFFSEYARFTSDLLSMGYQPEGTLRFKTGFLEAHRPDNPVGPTEGGARPVFSFDELDLHLRGTAGGGLSFAPEAQSLSLADAAAYCRQGCKASDVTFEALAVANLDDDPDLDVWVINETKALVHVHDDLAP